MDYNQRINVMQKACQ